MAVMVSLTALSRKKDQQAQLQKVQQEEIAKQKAELDNEEQQFREFQDMMTKEKREYDEKLKKK